jgi:hypothetical protein
MAKEINHRGHGGHRELLFSLCLIMAKEINHRGHGGHRELLFSLCPLCTLWFSKTHSRR